MRNLITNLSNQNVSKMKNRCKMKKQLLLFILCFPFFVSAQTLLLQESFEGDESLFDANSFDTGLDPGTDEFTIINSSNLPLGWDIAFTNVTDTYFWGGEDIVDPLNPLGENYSGYIVFNNLNVSTYATVQVTLSLAARQTYFEEYTNSIFYDYTDGIQIQYAFDNNIATTGDANVATGTYSTISQFKANSSRSLSLDTDFDGAGDGTELTAAFQDFTFNFSTGGSDNVSIRLIVTAQEGSEPIGIDNVRISGIGTSSSPATSIPTMQTNAVSSISTTSATANGNVTNFGGPTPTEYGFCYNKTGNPTTADSKLNVGVPTEIGSFNGALSSLDQGSRYFIKAYATNSEGTDYGKEKTFVTDISGLTLLQTVDFETTSGYSVLPADASAADYFQRTDGSDIAANVDFTNYQGTYFFAGEDLDNITPLNTEGSITLDAVNVSTYNSVQIKVLVAARGSGASFEGEEYLKIQYQLDGGGFNTVSQFVANNGNNEYLREDYNVDGTSDYDISGVYLSDSMLEYLVNFEVSGTSIQARMAMYNGGGEEMAFDNIRVYGTTQALPVELTSFSASIFDNAVSLSWATATEVNNYGFEIERKMESEDWSMLGFVEGHGNSNSPKFYEYVDKNPHVEKLSYRLKQLDIDGEFEYSDIVEVNVNHVPTEFMLGQNFPNPFNPTTKLQYSIPQNGLVQIKVYDMIGNEITTLINERKHAGTYEVEFDASNLSSGVYLYKIISGNYYATKKMLLLR